MSGKPIDEMTLENLHFFGIISASFSHEINNVVSIIKELSGLMSDYMVAAESGRPVDMMKFKDKNQKIIDSTLRGEGLIKNFNRFAHCADKPVQSIQLGELLKNFVSLTQRIAGLKGVTIIFSEEESPDISIDTNPFLLMNVLFIVLKEILDQSGESGKVEISMAQDRGKVQIVFENGVGTKNLTEGNGLNIFSRLLEGMNGSLEETVMQSGVYKTVLVLPD